MNDVNQQLNDKIAELERQKATIHQQEQFLRTIYNNVQEAIFVVDITAEEEFYYQGFNPAAHRLTGIDQVIGKTPAEIFPPTVAKEIEQHYRQCLESKTTISYEECLPFEGQDTWWLTSLNPIKDQFNNISRIIGTSLNISDRKQAETELAAEKMFIKALLDNLSDGIVACDENGILALFNEPSLEFFGEPQKPIPPEEWARHYSLYDAFGKELLKQAEIPLFRAFSGESFINAELMAIPPNGKPRNLLANGSPIVDPQGIKLGAVVAVRDITERRQAEQALAKLNEELEDRVKQRTTQLEQVNALLLSTTATLEKRNQELDQFAYVTSHDLKAPLRAIANLSEWIEEDLEDKLDDDTRHNMNLLRGRVHRLENLINGLLDYSRVGRVNSEPELVNVATMLAGIIDLLAIPDSCQIEISPSMPTFTTQLIPLQQVFHNLISNAIKHGGSNNNRVTISVEEHDLHYEFGVSDSGQGIDPKDHDRIFTIFQTLEARDQCENTGIGLSIVKKAVENQGGEIRVESRLNAGTTFRFTWQKNI